MAERLENCRLLVARNGSQDHADRVLLEEDAALSVAECRYRDLALGVVQMLGDLPAESRIRLPAKANDDGLTTVDVPSEQATLFEETIEFVHDGLVASDIVARSSSPSFSEGAIISWHDLNRNLDVSRDLTNEIRGLLTKLLEDNRVVAIRLKHKPGAGATTIARRLAWEYRNLYPTCLIKLYNDSTADHLERVYQLTGLPLFIVAERANLLPGLRDRLFDDLRGRHIRFVFLDVIRSNTLQSENLSFLLDDQMVGREARRFFELYGRWCNENRKDALHHLTFDDQFREFRSPFFYTLYAFERDFSNVPDYVRSYREGLADAQKTLLGFLAVIGSYSQQWLPFPSLGIIARNTTGTDGALQDMVGAEATKFVLFDGEQLKVIHPILAKEILRQHLLPASAEYAEDWKVPLPDFCVQFVERLADDQHFRSDVIDAILTDLFVSRNENGPAEERAEFSDLILELPTPQGRRRVLETLCKHFGSNPHYWNHLGRLLNFQSSEPYTVAAECYRTAIARAEELGEDAGSHYHGLGMVYRSEVRSLLREPLNVGESVWDRVQAVHPIYKLAEEAFGCARDLSVIDEYPRISHIQMITRAVEEILKKSDVKT
jgi:hypothetical protein